MATSWHMRNPGLTCLSKKGMLQALLRHISSTNAEKILVSYSCKKRYCQLGNVAEHDVRIAS